MRIDHAEFEQQQEGKFSGVPHEMTDLLMRLDLTARESRLVFFFIRNLQGWQMKERIIATKDIIRDTGLRKDHAIGAVKSLVEKGVLERYETRERGKWCYRFHENNFGRVHATKVIHTDPEVIHIRKKFLKLVPESGTTKDLNQVPGSTQSGYHEVPNSGTTNTYSPAVVADTQFSKDTLKDTLKENLKEMKSFNFKETDEEAVRKSKEKYQQQKRMMGLV